MPTATFAGTVHGVVVQTSKYVSSHPSVVIGKKENLPVLSIIADDASYLEDMGDFSGKNAKKHPELIIDYLTKIYHGKHLLKSMNYTHRYPACWRCRSELVWKVAEEWYIAMDKKEDESKLFRNHGKDTIIGC